MAMSEASDAGPLVGFKEIEDCLPRIFSLIPAGDKASHRHVCLVSKLFLKHMMGTRQRLTLAKSAWISSFCTSLVQLSFGQALDATSIRILSALPAPELLMQLHLKMDCYISDEVAAVLCRFTQLRVLVFGCRIVRGNGFGQVYEGVKSTLVKLDLSGSMGRTADVRDALHHVSTLTCLKLLYLDYTNASHLPALPVSLTHLTAANINSSQGLDLRYLTRLRSLGLDAVCVQGLRCPQSLHVLDVSASEIWYDPLDAIRDAAQLTALYAYGCGWGTSELIAILPTTLVAMEIGKFEKDTRDLARICSHLPKLNFLGFALWGDQNEEIGLGLTVLTALSGLTYLDVSDPESSMCESVFKYVGTLTSLEHLRIEGDSERDALPNSCLRHLSNLTRLTCLDAKYNGFTDAGKTLLSHLPRLKLLKC